MCLRRAVSGDGPAARALSIWLNGCNGRNFATDAEFDQFLDSYQQTHTLTRIIRNQPVKVTKTPTPEILDQLRQAFTFCQGVPDSDVRAADSWLEAAAEAGNVQASMELGQTHVGSEKGITHLEEAWLAGSVDAASWLANALATQSNPANRDFVNAYAYQKVYATLVRADFERRGIADIPFNQVWMEGDSVGLQNYSNQLSPRQIAEANLLASRILQENTNCCFDRP